MKTTTLSKIAMLITASLFSFLPLKADIGAISFKSSAAGMNALETTIGSTQITIETWLYIDENVGFFASNMHNDKGFILGFDGWFKFQLDGNAIWIDPTAWKGQWTHIACVADGSHLTVYANGEQVGTQENPAGYNTEADGKPLYLGLAPWGNPCACKMADFRLWSVARTADEIKDNYQKQIDPSTAGLIKNFNFAEGSGDHTVNLADPEGNQAWCMGTIDTDYSWEMIASTPSNLRIENKTENSFSLLWDGTEGNTWSVELLDGDQVIDTKSDLTVMRADFTDLEKKNFNVRVKAHAFMETEFSEAITVDLSSSSSIHGVIKNISIARQNGLLQIDGTNAGDHISIYNGQGALYRQITADNETTVIRTDEIPHGIYFVRIGGNPTYKIIL